MPSVYADARYIDDVVVSKARARKPPSQSLWNSWGRRLIGMMPQRMPMSCCCISRALGLVPAGLHPGKHRGWRWNLRTSATILLNPSCPALPCTAACSFFPPRRGCTRLWCDAKTKGVWGVGESVQRKKESCKHACLDSGIVQRAVMHPRPRRTRCTRSLHSPQVQKRGSASNRCEPLLPASHQRHLAREHGQHLHEPSGIPRRDEAFAVERHGRPTV